MRVSELVSKQSCHSCVFLIKKMRCVSFIRENNGWITTIEDTPTCAKMEIFKCLRPIHSTTWLLDNVLPSCIQVFIASVLSFVIPLFPYFRSVIHCFVPLFPHASIHSLIHSFLRAHRWLSHGFPWINFWVDLLCCENRAGNAGADKISGFTKLRNEVANADMYFAKNAPISHGNAAANWWCRMNATNRNERTFLPDETNYDPVRKLTIRRLQTDFVKSCRKRSCKRNFANHILASCKQ